MTPAEVSAVVRVLREEKYRVHIAREVLTRDLGALNGRRDSNPELVHDWQIAQVSRQLDAARAVEGHLGRMLGAYPSNTGDAAVTS